MLLPKFTAEVDELDAVKIKTSFLQKKKKIMQRANYYNDVEAAFINFHVDFLLSLYCEIEEKEANTQSLK